MTAREVSPRLERWVRRSFDAGSVQPVLAELRALPDLAVGLQDVERIQASLVIRTGGDWQAFQSMLRLVNQDWRDALVAGELAHGDWPQRLDAVLGR